MAPSRVLCRCTAAISASIALVVAGCSYFPESSFTLADESRVPRWLTLKPGQSRAEVRVTVDYYIDQSGRTATFTLFNSLGIPVQRVTGQLRGLYPLKRKTALPGFPEGYPSYEVISVGSQVEIIEHRQMEPIFYVSDDPNVWAEFAEHG